MEFTKYKLKELGTVYSGGTPSTKKMSIGMVIFHG